MNVIEKKTEAVLIRLTATEKNYLTQEATKMNLTVTELVRNSIITKNTAR